MVSISVSSIRLLTVIQLGNGRLQRLACREHWVLKPLGSNGRSASCYLNSSILRFRRAGQLSPLLLYSLKLEYITEWLPEFDINLSPKLSFVWHSQPLTIFPVALEQLRPTFSSSLEGSGALQQCWQSPKLQTEWGTLCWWTPSAVSPASRIVASQSLSTWWPVRPVAYRFVWRPCSRLSGWAWCTCQYAWWRYETGGVPWSVAAGLRVCSEAAA